MAQTKFVVVQVGDDGKPSGYAANVNGNSAEILKEIESSHLFTDVVAARQLNGALQNFDPDTEYQVKEVKVSISLV